MPQPTPTRGPVGQSPRRRDPRDPHDVGVAAADVLHVPGTDHFGLLNHPRVYDALRTWLG